jgi:6-phosphofructokinase
MIKKMHPESELFGFLNGPYGIYSNNYIKITKEYMNLFRNTGGFDMIRKLFTISEISKNKLLSSIRNLIFIMVSYVMITTLYFIRLLTI